MTLIRDPVKVGFALRFWRVYREKRRPHRSWVGTETGAVQIRVPAITRRLALQIAWRQARNAQF